MTVVSFHDLAISRPGVTHFGQQLISLVIERGQLVHIICNDVRSRKNLTTMMRGNLQSKDIARGHARFMGQTLQVGGDYRKALSTIHIDTAKVRPLHRRAALKLLNEMSVRSTGCALHPSLTGLISSELARGSEDSLLSLESSCRLRIAKALASHPDLLIIDGLEALEPQQRADLLGIICSLADHSTASIVVWHNFLKAKPPLGIVYHFDSHGLKLKILPKRANVL